MQSVLTITGPTCAGKTTLLRHLVDHHDFTEIVGLTTRPPRQGEQDGKSYHFLSKDDFMARLNRGELVEYTFFDGVYYGLAPEDIAIACDTGKTPVTVMDPPGVRQMQMLLPPKGWTVKTVFVAHAQQILLTRLFQRFRDDAQADPERYARRVKTMLEEEPGWEHALFYDLRIAALDAHSTPTVVEAIINLVNQTPLQARQA